MMETFVFGLVVAIALGAGAGSIANSKARTVGGWFWLVFLTSLFALVPGLVFFAIVACLPKIERARVVSPDAFAAAVKRLS